MILDLERDIFSTQFKKSNLYNTFYQEWIMSAYTAELDATTMYPVIQDRIKNKIYDLSQFSAEENQEILNYLSNMHTDEAEHADYFKSILESIHGKSLKLPSVDDLPKTHWDHSMERTLMYYYIGECHLWVSFYKMYLDTTNPIEKKSIKQLLVDESQHNNNIYKILKKIKGSIHTDINWFIDQVLPYRYFGFINIRPKFSLYDLDSKKNQKMLQFIYDTKWQHHFNQLFVKKLYKAVTVLYPTISREQFINMVYGQDGSWVTNPLITVE
jgi:rubrerythrin